MKTDEVGGGEGKVCSSLHGSRRGYRVFEMPTSRSVRGSRRQEGKKVSQKAWECFSHPLPGFTEDIAASGICKKNVDSCLPDVS